MRLAAEKNNNCLFCWSMVFMHLKHTANQNKPNIICKESQESKRKRMTIVLIVIIIIIIFLHQIKWINSLYPLIKAKTRAYIDYPAAFFCSV